MFGRAKKHTATLCKTVNYLQGKTISMAVEKPCSQYISQNIPNTNNYFPIICRITQEITIPDISMPTERPKNRWDINFQ